MTTQPWTAGSERAVARHAATAAAAVNTSITRATSQISCSCALSEGVSSAILAIDLHRASDTPVRDKLLCW
jgi:hypothetical protein